MKHLRHIILPLFTALLCGCQTIPSDKTLIAVEPSEISMHRNVLLVEFTGYQCLNCPLAAEEAHKLLERYEENLVVVAMHPKQVQLSRHPLLMCPESGIYFEALGGNGATGLPTGSINMSASLRSYTDWAGDFIRSAMTMPALSLALSAVAPAQSSDTLYHATITLSSTTNQPSAMRVLLWVTEDDVVAPQKQPDGSVIEDNHHQHVLRAELLSEDGWGEALTLRDTRTIETSFTLPGNVIKAEHCHLVAVVMDEDSREVLNVKQIKLQ